MEIPQPHTFLIELGSLLFFQKFPFKGGLGPTDKLMIVLHSDKANGNHTTFTFTTTQGISKINPAFKMHQFCSCDLTLRDGIDFFFLKKNEVIGEDNFSMDEDSLIMFQGNVAEREMAFFEKYSIGKHERIQYLTKLNDDVLLNILNCVVKSVHLTEGQEAKIKQSIEIISAKAN